MGGAFFGPKNKKNNAHILLTGIMFCFIGRQNDTFIYLLPHVNNSPKPRGIKRNPPSSVIMNVQIPVPIPRHGAGSPGDEGPPPTQGLESLLGTLVEG